MAYREVTMIEVKEILRLWLAEVPKKRIAGMLGADRKTVQRYTALAAEQGLAPGQGADALTDERLELILVALKTTAGRPRGESWERCIEQRAFIEEKIKNVKLSKVRRLLLRRGVDIPYATLHRFAVAELGYGRRARTIPIADGEPGVEVQLDTGWVGWLERDLFGKRRRFRAWVFTPVVSRHRFVWPVFPETTETAIEACEEAWRFYGEPRVEEACATALAFEMHDVRRLKRMLENATAPPPLAAPESSRAIPLARYLRPASQYALPLPSTESTATDNTEGEDR